ncbi:tRNA (adenosine(37)-N6)-threonylcarbamoyltransferase complex ATPase subunit type 1 TsaE [Roseibium litorale]|uniref:tRNA threonylcarbamoyladenosine biosynthesis protein TsaE n=1 Tax=Roseibium litorale TaxID=2803841 RepID=A0ABR9CM07_9HYPH|nr:tRNA (adenosine(37)-N6)-threonylcarbamoyltransferase complex ATPase subunit type 1 TsaE [Roseibium litorale]MBD8891768.1 tRNA (adenosine(37)-N6)-threonylcarbamoyltransferase complex ATPase subunit type 1 TsaE [Roseibium litorale]
MAQDAPSSPFRTVEIADEDAMVRLAEDIAAILKPGDVIALSGDLGAGKSTFSRALLRSFAGDPELEVPSPTFTLVQTYELGRLTISHFDLYRLEEPEELEELGLDELAETGAALIEWPERAWDGLPRDHLVMRIIQGGEDDRRTVDFELSPDAATRWETRLTRTFRIRDLIAEAGLDASRGYLSGDASYRVYEKLTGPAVDAILMNSPEAYQLALPGQTRSYGEIVHRARTVDAFIALTEALRRRNLSAPQILASDREAGLLILENLGSEGILTPDRQPVPERYALAVELLVELHAANDFPRELPVGSGGSYRIPDYSEEALLTEADLFLDWYMPWRSGAQIFPAEVSRAQREEYRDLWRAAFAVISGAQTGWVLRDYHSPNILWQDARTGLAKIGLIDYQDCLIGSVAYDLASLLMDARADVPVVLEQELFASYLSGRKARDAGFDAELFGAAYAVMGAQRIAKILGIFVRLAKQENKSAYIQHMPRMEAYLERVLAHPVLSDLHSWFRRSLGG